MKRAACTAALLVAALPIIATQARAQTVAKPGVAVIAADPCKVQEVPGKKPAKAATSGTANGTASGASLATRINSGQKAPRAVALPGMVPAIVPKSAPSPSSAAGTAGSASASAAARDTTAAPPVRRAPVTGKSKPPRR